MKFECGDLERALANPELMPEAREHLKQCAACRREYRLWNEISASAKELREEWDSPELWSKIRQSLEAEPKPKQRPVWWREWKLWSAAAAALIAIAAVLWLQPWQANPPASNPAAPEQMAQTTGDHAFLTEQALQDVERTEAAYRKSIDRLSHLAAPELQKPASALAVSYREKLLMLDSAISDTRTNLDHNRFNVRLQTELADLYREKQQTLKELLTRDQKN